MRHNKTLDGQEHEARTVVAGDEAARTPRLRNSPQPSDELSTASLERARLVGSRATSPTSRRDHPRGRRDHQLPRSLARRGVHPGVQTRFRRQSNVRPRPQRDRSPIEHRVHRAGPQSLRRDRTVTAAIAANPQSPVVSHQRTQRRHRHILPVLDTEAEAILDALEPKTPRPKPNDQIEHGRRCNRLNRRHWPLKNRREESRDDVVIRRASGRGPFTCPIGCILSWSTYRQR